jgi:hypothetical protein
MSNEEKKSEQKHKECAERFGLEYAGHLVPKNFDRDRRVVKVNLPNCEQDWKSGNGEGCWGYLKREEDLERYYKGEGDFKIILLNDSFYYRGVLNWGTVIMAEGRGPENRPVLKKDWITLIMECNGIKESDMK